MTKICIPQRVILCKINDIQYIIQKLWNSILIKKFNYYHLNIHNKFHSLDGVCSSNVKDVYHTDLVHS